MPTIKDIILSAIPDSIKQATVASLIDSMADDFKPEVILIEANEFPTTKDNYGQYMTLLSIAPNKFDAAMIYAALEQAGGNQRGLAAAYKVCYG